MHLEHDEGSITLCFERSPNQRAMAALHALLMGGLVCLLLFGAIHLLVTAPATRGGTALFLAACAAFAAWNGATSLLEADYATVFDLKARTVSVTETSIMTRGRGPISFDEVAGLSNRVGFASNHRSVIAELILTNGDTWRLGYELIWLKPSSSSDIPGLIKMARKATGLRGQHSE